MARNFNNTSDLIGLGTSAIIGTANWSTALFSIGGWLNGAAGASNQNKGLYTEGNHTSSTLQWGIFTQNGSPNNKVRVALANTTQLVVSNAVVLDNTWHHVLITFDGAGNWVLYVDGASDSSGSGATAGNSSPDRPAFGALIRSSTGNFFGGELAHWAIWSRKLSAGEAASLASGTLPTHFGATHYWPLWGADSPEPDIGTSASKVTGTLTGTTKGTGDAPVNRYLLRGNSWSKKQSIVITNKSDADSGTLSSGVITAGPATDKSDTDHLFTGDFNALAPAISGSDTFTSTAAVGGVALSSTDSGALSSTTTIAQQGTTPSDVQPITFTEAASIAATLSSSDAFTETPDQGAIRNPNVLQDNDGATMTEAATNASGGIGQAIRGVCIAFEDDALTAVPTWTRLDDPHGTS